MEAMKALPKDQVRLGSDGQGPVVTVIGSATGEVARELETMLESFPPARYPLTLDLHRATALDPMAIHAMMRAFELRYAPSRRMQVLVMPGPVCQLLKAVGLDRSLELVPPRHADPLRVLDRTEWEQAQEATIDHYHELMAAARRRDLPAFQQAALHAYPVCIALGAPPGGTAFGAWCERCPMHHQYGGCWATVRKMQRAAAQGNWDTAQLLVLALIDETAGISAPATGKTA